MILLISLLCSFLVFIMIFFSSMHLLKKKTNVSDRVRFYTGYAPEEEERQEKEALKDRVRKAFRKRLRETAPKKNTMNLNLLMDRAGLPILGSEFLVMSNGSHCWFHRRIPSFFQCCFRFDHCSHCALMCMGVCPLFSK